MNTAASRLTSQDPAPAAERYLSGVVAALSLGAGAIHFAVAPEHLAEYWLFGAFFVVIAWVQVTLAGPWCWSRGNGVAARCSWSV